MTANNFKRYCQRNRLTRVVPTEHCIDFFFAKGKRIVATSGYDGLIYSIWKKPKPEASRQLLSDLNSLAPNMIEDMKRKYQDSGTMLFASSMKQTGQ